MSKRVYLSIRFYTADPYKGWNIDMELKGLSYLYTMLIEKGKYEVAALVHNRMEEIKTIKKQLNQIIPWRYALKTTSWSLN